MGYQIVGGHVYDDDGNMVGALVLPRNLNLGRGGAGGGLARLPFSPNAGARAAAAPLGPRLRETMPSRIDETPLPVTATSVAAGATAVIPITSQIIFEPKRLIVPDSIAPFFTIDDFRVGNVPLFAGAGSVPAEAFSPQSVNPNIRKITANPGVQVILTVTNLDAVAHIFRAVVFGEGAQPEGCG